MEENNLSKRIKELKTTQEPFLIKMPKMLSVGNELLNNASKTMQLYEKLKREKMKENKH